MIKFHNQTPCFDFKNSDFVEQRFPLYFVTNIPLQFVDRRDGNSQGDTKASLSDACFKTN